MPHPEASGVAKQATGFIRHTVRAQSLAGRSHIWLSRKLRDSVRKAGPEAIFVLTGGSFSFPLPSQPDILV